MSWLNWVDPVAGGILAGAIIPPLLLLYFLKLRRRTQPIACTILWKRSVEDLRANAPFQRLRTSLLLFLQLLALAMLILAIMQPQLRAGYRTGGRVIMLIDNSASMNATDMEGGITRLEEAKSRARNVIESMQSSGIFGGTADEVMIIAFNARAEVMCNFTDSRQQLLSAVDSIEPTDLPTRVEEALELARAHTTVIDPDNPDQMVVGKPATIDLFTDGRIQDWSAQVPKGEPMNFYPIGGNDWDNVAFASVAADRPFDQPGSLQVFASLVNYNQRTVTCRVQMSVDRNVDGSWIRDVEIDAATVDEASGRLVPGRTNVIFGPFAQPHGAMIEVANLRDDSLAVDNFAWLVTPAPRNLDIAIVEPQFPLIEQALRGMKMKRNIVTLSADQFDQAANEGALANYDVIVLDRHSPATLPPGRYLSLGAALPLDAIVVEDSIDQVWTPADWDREHAVLRYVNLNNLILTKVDKLKGTDRFRTLVEVAAATMVEPGIIEYADDAHQVIHLAFQLIDTNWFWDTSFVIFMVNAVEYLGSYGEAASERVLSPGEPIALRLPADATGISMTAPTAESSEVIETADPTSVSYSRTDRAGFYEIDWTSGQTTSSQVFAVSMLDESESNIMPVEELKWGGTSASSEGKAAGLQTPLWPWALAFCLLVLMIEWWVYHRKTSV